MGIPSLYYTMLDQAASAKNKEGASWLKLPIFDVTDIAATFPSDQNVKDQLQVPVPRRPPFEELWVECERIEIDNHPSIGDFQHTWQEGWVIWRDDKLKDSIEWSDFEVGATYGYITYLQLKKTSIRTEFRSMVGRLFSTPSLGILAYSPDWTRTGSSHIGEGIYSEADEVSQMIREGRSTQRSIPDPLARHCLPFPVVNKDVGIFVSPWYPMMAFGLLNCVNVGTETEAAPKRANEERARKHGLPVRPGYKTLRIHVPRRPTGPTIPGESEGSSKRLHFVRGHFHLLKSARYHKPGYYWWSPHLRGDPELGTVEKDYGISMGDQA